ncbi:MAG TPA: peptidoglycan DD-metalloendopeptidase family protein [Candidatus Angelobacter sp.]|nr:peptidoglycan DD-metalloendopeptidase family protein [Candidatus Angelobacter sp.]
MRGSQLKVVLAAVAVAMLVGGAYYARVVSAKRVAIKAEAAPTPAPAPKDQVTRLEIVRGVTFSELLQHAGLDASVAGQLIEPMQRLIQLRRIRPGQDVFLVKSQQGEVESLRYRLDPADEIVVTRHGKEFEAQKEKIPSTTQTVTVAGKVDGSLFDAVIAAGEHPALAVRLAQIFAWDLDFYTDPRPGDTFRLVVEKSQYQGASTVDYGRIFAAEYDNAGSKHTAVLFHDRAGRPAYYSADGKSLQKEFLRSPLRFEARITSHYNPHRFHPILKRYLPHLGTDYGAPIGSPVQAVARGEVEFAGRRGGDGNMVLLRHANGYETYYLHLSRILVHRGQAVQQGQLVGLVGQTGLATGPHLDFRVRRAGKFINFERMNLPPTRPVLRADLPAFEAMRDKWFGQMENTAVTSAKAVAPSPAQQAAQ